MNTAAEQERQARFEQRVRALRTAAEAIVAAGMNLLEGTRGTEVWRVTVLNGHGYSVWTLQGGLLDVFNAHSRSNPGYGGVGEIVSIVREHEHK